MYAAGAEHPLREPCREILAYVAESRLEGVVSAEVIQEIPHRCTRSPAEGAELAEAALDLFRPSWRSPTTSPPACRTSSAGIPTTAPGT